MEREQVRHANSVLRDKSFDEILQLLPILLKPMSNEAKIELLSDLLCGEWYTVDHHIFVTSVLKIYEQSLLSNSTF